jgi:hypothetical protein
MQCCRSTRDHHSLRSSFACLLSRSTQSTRRATRTILEPHNADELACELRASLRQSSSTKNAIADHAKGASSCACDLLITSECARFGRVPSSSFSSSTALPLTTSSLRIARASPCPSSTKRDRRSIGKRVVICGSHLTVQALVAYHRRRSHRATTQSYSL